MTSGGHPEDRLSSLYRPGAVAAVVALGCYVAGLILVAAQGRLPTDADSLLRYVNSHPVSYALRQLVWLAPGLAMALVSLALAAAFRHRAAGLALVAGTLGTVAWLLSFAWPTTGDGSLVMVWLAQRYDAADSSSRTSFVAGAQTLLAMNDAVSPVGILQTLGILLLSVLVLRAGSASRAVRRLGWVGVATGTVGTLSEAARPWIGAAYGVYGVLLVVWLALVAQALWRRHGAVSR